ncbi:MAG TPA: hypothetical protein VD886_07605 [Herpetosiphonaceae bacterium]|nr:hypothetical protein [Herpetosiphonaceae bacterium]
MKHRRWGILALWLVCWAILAAPASAQDNVVIDLNTSQSIDQARLRTAAQQLTAKGARVVIVVTDNGGSGDGLAYLDGRLKALGVANSSRNSDIPVNAMIYYVSFNPRVSSFFFGNNFRPALDESKSNDLRLNQLNAGLKANNPTKGLVDIMNGTARVLADPVGARTETSSGGTSGLTWVIGIIAVGGLLLFVVPSFLRRRSQAAATGDALSQARARFDASKKAAGAAIADLGRQMSDAAEKQRFDKVSYPPSQVQDLGQRHRRAEAQFQQLQVQFDDINERIDANPTPSVTDLEGAAGGYDGIRTQGQQISQALSEMDALRKEFDMLAAAAPGEVDRAKKS